MVITQELTKKDGVLVELPHGDGNSNAPLGGDSASNVTFGTTAGTAAEGNDARIVGAASRYNTPLDTPFVSFGDPNTPGQHPRITPSKRINSNEVDLVLEGMNRLFIDAARVRCLTSLWEVPNGFEFAGAAFLNFQAATVSLQTDGVNTKIFEGGRGNSTTLRPYLGSFSVVLEGQSSQTAPLLALTQRSDSDTVRYAGSLDAVVTDSSDASFSAKAVISTCKNGVVAPRFEVDDAQFRLLNNVKFRAEDLPASVKSLDIPIWHPGMFADIEVVLKMQVTTSFKLKAGLVGSKFKLDTSPSVPILFNIRKNGNSVGSVYFDAGSTVSTSIDFSTDQTWLAENDDVFIFLAPAAVQGQTMAGLSATLKGELA